MKKIIEKIRDLPYLLGAVMTMPLIALPQESVAAGIGGGGLAGAKDTWKTQMAGVGDIVSMGCGVVGLVMSAAGVMKLKQAADSQGQQTKYGEGLWRLGVGGALCALPAVSSTMTGTVTGTNGTGNEFDITVK